MGVCAGKRKAGERTSERRRREMEGERKGKWGENSRASEMGTERVDGRALAIGLSASLLACSPACESA